MSDQLSAPAKDFGELIRIWRIRNHQTQEGLAEKSGLSSRSIAGLERGEVRRPRRSTVELLADALGLTGDARAEFRRSADVQYRDGDRAISSAISCSSSRRATRLRQ
jgi:transcriptional regulator with XRE-family HTH domain